MWVLFPWKPREKENGGSFYPYFYLSDQRFDAHSTGSFVRKYDFSESCLNVHHKHDKINYTILTSGLNLKMQVIDKNVLKNYNNPLSNILMVLLSENTLE